MESVVIIRTLVVTSDINESVCGRDVVDIVFGANGIDSTWIECHVFSGLAEFAYMDVEINISTF